MTMPIEIPRKHRSPWDSKHALLHICVGLAFTVLLILSFVIKDPPEVRALVRDLALAIGPVWMLGLLYQHFLFKEIREAATEASSEALIREAQPLIEKIRDTIQELQTQVENMMHLRDLGIERAFKVREGALGLVCEWLRAEKNEIAVVGTSLRGLFWSELGGKEQEVTKVLRERLGEKDRTCRFKFLLTHPAYADLRGQLERPNRAEDVRISLEIRTSVKRLLEFGAKPEEIRFIRAAPTCFAVKTSDHMLINPYPLENQGLSSFCIVVGNQADRNRIYSDFERNHFVFDSKNCTRLSAAGAEDLDRILHQSLQSLNQVADCEPSNASALAH